MLIDMPPLLREIVRQALTDEADFELVGEHDAVDDLAATVADDRADFVIVGSAAVADGPVASLVAAQRGVRALEVRHDGTESVLYELRPHRVSLGEISADTLRRTIRAATPWSVEP